MANTRSTICILLDRIINRATIKLTNCKITFNCIIISWLTGAKCQICCRCAHCLRYCTTVSDAMISLWMKIIVAYAYTGPTLRLHIGWANTLIHLWTPDKAIYAIAGGIGSSTCRVGNLGAIEKALPGYCIPAPIISTIALVWIRLRRQSIMNFAAIYYAFS